MFELSNVYFSYEDRTNIFGRKRSFPVLRGVNLSINSGQTIGIYGDNGSGKSTLLKIIAGVFSPSSGGRKSQENISINLQSLSLGFQDKMTGYQNIILNGLIKGYNLSEIKKNIKLVEEFAGVNEYFYQPLRQYSTGMRSRLGFGSTIYEKCDLLLIDESLSVGDSEFSVKAQENIIGRQGDGGSTVIVSHDIFKLRELCDVVFKLSEGVLESD